MKRHVSFADYTTVRDYARIPPSCNAKYWHQPADCHANNQLVNCERLQPAVPVARSSFRCYCVRTENLPVPNKMPDKKNLYRNGNKKSTGHGGSERSAGHQESKNLSGKANGKEKAESEAAKKRNGNGVAEGARLESSSPTHGHEDSCENPLPSTSSVPQQQEPDVEMSESSDADYGSSDYTSATSMPGSSSSATSFSTSTEPAHSSSAESQLAAADVSSSMECSESDPALSEEQVLQTGDLDLTVTDSDELSRSC